MTRFVVLNQLKFSLSSLLNSLDGGFEKNVSYTLQTVISVALLVLITFTQRLYTKKGKLRFLEWIDLSYAQCLRLFAALKVDCLHLVTVPGLSLS